MNRLVKRRKHVTHLMLGAMRNGRSSRIIQRVDICPMIQQYSRDRRTPRCARHMERSGTGASPSMNIRAAIEQGSDHMRFSGFVMTWNGIIVSTCGMQRSRTVVRYRVKIRPVVHQHVRHLVFSKFTRNMQWGSTNITPSMDIPSTIDQHSYNINIAMRACDMQRSALETGTRMDVRPTIQQCGDDLRMSVRMSVGTCGMERRKTRTTSSMNIRPANDQHLHRRRLSSCTRDVEWSATAGISRADILPANEQRSHNTDTTLLARVMERGNRIHPGILL